MFSNHINKLKDKLLRNKITVKQNINIKKKNAILQTFYYKKL